MSLEVYFGNNLIDEEYYTGLTNSYELFNDSFRLGTTPSNIYKLSIAKEGVTNQPSNVILKDNNTTFAELEIDNIEEQDYTYSYDLTDKMLNLEFYYDASEIFVNGKTTLLAIAQDICSKAGLTLGTTNFRGYNKEISWYDNRRTAREYIGFIAELNGGFARVENSTLYFRKQKTSSKKTIDIDDCENFIIGEYHKTTRVVYELGALKYEFGDDTGNTLYLNSDNVFITEESEVQAIYNDIKDFEFYSFETGNCPIDYSVKAGDIITFTDGTNNYPTIAQYELEYFGTWIGGYSLSVNTERQEETKVVGNTEKIKNLQVIVDRDANTITELVETTEEIEHQFETLQDIDGFAEGKYIYLDDASDELITSAKFNGETSQETRSGKNLLNISNTQIQLVKSTNRTTSITPLNTVTLSAGTYTISFPDLVVQNSTSNLRVSLVGVESGGTVVTNKKRTITITEQKTLTSLYVYLANNDNDNATATFTKIQLESGSTATDYEEFGAMPSPDYPSEIENLEGSLEVKVVNKNIFNKNANAIGSNVTKTVLDTGVRVTTKVAGNARYCGIEIGRDELLGKTLTISSIMSASGTNGPCVRLFFGDATTPAKTVLGSTLTTSSSLTVTIPNSFPMGTDRIYLLMYSSLNSSEVGAYVDYTNLQVEISDEATEYEEYKEQTVYFPLEEGQKLYEGSYLADDGIHNKTRELILAIADMNNGEDYPGWINQTQLKVDYPSINTTFSGANIKYKSNISNSNNKFSLNTNGSGILFLNKSQWEGKTQSQWKTDYPDLVLQFQYELPEEEIIPYNTEQQAAWNSIRNLHTYKNITHIYSDAYAEIGYIKDNMLSAFETKASAQLTKNDVSQLKIENGRISSEVSSTQSQLNNYYTKNEADNNTNSTKAELQNIIQQNKTEIEQTIDSITSTVSKKVGNDEIISKINQSAEAIQINAEKISLEGKTIKVLGGTQTKPKFSISDTDYETFNNLNGVAILPNRIWMKNGTKTSFWIVANSSGGANLDMPYDSEISLYEYSGGNTININGKTGNIKCISLTQTSLASEKKNFKKLDNALDIIKNIDIYKYNLKNEKDTDKKHIGFVIGDNYNYSKEVTSIDNEGVDNYSFTSLCCKAIQEQQEEIEELKKEIEKLKGGK